MFFYADGAIEIVDDYWKESGTWARQSEWKGFTFLECIDKRSYVQVDDQFELVTP